MSQADATRRHHALTQELLARWPEQEQEYAVLAVDGDGIILWASPAAQGLVGYGRSELVGQPMGLLFTPEDRERRLHLHELTIARHVGFSEDDRWHVRRDGTRVWISGVTTAVRDDDGALLGFAKVMRDRTDLKAQLVTLQNRVQSQQQAEEQRLQFEMTLAHEQANAMNALATAVELVRRTADLDPQIVQMMQRQLDSLQRLLEDLRAGARALPEARRLVYGELDLQDALTTVARGLGRDADASNVQLHTLLPEGRITLEADRQRLQQIVHNLLINAIKYTPAGGSVWLKATVEGEHAAIRVEDNGVGISGEMLPEIFKLFTQEARSQHLARGGSGIGLAVVKQWVDAHEGTVEVRSEGRGKGAGFTVRLPLKRRQPAAPTLRPE